MSTEAKSKTVQVGLSTTEIVKNNPDRVQLTFVNNGNNTVHVDITNEVSTSLGVKISAGGSISITKADDGELVNRKWLGISEVAASNLRVFEVIKIGGDKS